MNILQRNRHNKEQVLEEQALCDRTVMSFQDVNEVRLSEVETDTSSSKKPYLSHLSCGFDTTNESRNIHCLANRVRMRNSLHFLRLSDNWLYSTI